MLKLRIIQPGFPDQVLSFARDSALIGRKPEQGVDIVIDQPFVSARHAIILKGTVVIDQGSSNGTFVDGQRIREPALVRNEVTLGRDDVRIVIDEGDSIERDRTEAPGVSSSSRRPVAPAPVLDPVSELRRRNAELEARVAELEGRIASALEQPGMPRSRGPLAELEARLAEHTETIRKLRAELDAAQHGR